MPFVAPRAIVPALTVVAPVYVLALARTTVPVPEEVRAPAPATMPPIVRVVAAFVLRVPAPVRAMPRSGSRVIVAVVLRVPPLKTSWPGVGTAGGVPRPLSAAMTIVPALIVVAPVYVLTPDRVRVPVPDLVSETVPEPEARTPEYVVVPLLPPALRVTAPAALEVTPPAPASEPIVSL